MTRGRQVPVILLGFTIGLVATAVPADEPLAVPHTIPNVWYRTDTEHGAFGPKHEGDLRITDRALEFSARKAELTVPLAAMRMISYGPMGGDFDTEWVAIGTEQSGAVSIVGLRDGSRMGYGGRTPEIYATLLRFARERGLAQFSAPDGFVPWTIYDRQIALAAPREYHPLQSGIAIMRGSTVRGTVVFSPDAPGGPGAEESLTEENRRAILERVRRAESPAWVLVIEDARRGMRCSGVKDKGRAKLEQWIGGHPFLGWGLIAPARLEPAPFDRCSGLAGTWSGKLDSGESVAVDVLVASDDEFVYAFALRDRVERRPGVVDAFERGKSTLKLAVARTRLEGSR